MRESHGKQKKMSEEAKACIRKHKERFPHVVALRLANNSSL